MTKDEQMKQEWVDRIKHLTARDLTDKRIENFARAIVLAINEAEGGGFIQAKEMMQKQLDQMRWDFR